MEDANICSQSCNKMQERTTVKEFCRWNARIFIISEYLESEVRNLRKGFKGIRKEEYIWNPFIRLVMNQQLSSLRKKNQNGFKVLNA